MLCPLADLSAAGFLFGDEGLAARKSADPVETLHVQGSPTMSTPRAPRSVVHLRVWRCSQCSRILFEHERPLEAVAEALGLLRLKGGSRNRVHVRPRPREVAHRRTRKVCA